MNICVVVMECLNLDFTKNCKQISGLISLKSLIGMVFKKFTTSLVS